MAYTNATADDLQSAFPRFSAVADPTVEYWLTQARRSVDETWTEGDYAMGQMLLAAHLMTIEGLGAGAEAEMAAEGAAGFKTIRSGALTLERFDSGNGGGSSGYASTSYGQRFARLQRLNVGGPRVMPTGTMPYDPRRFPHGEA